MNDQQRLGSAPIEQDYRGKMTFLAGELDNFFNDPGSRDTGFILMVFPFGHDGRCNYISNASRRDVIMLLKEQLRYFEGQSDSLSGNA